MIPFFSTVLIFTLELIIPYPLKSFFHGIPVLYGLYFRSNIKYLVVFLLSSAQVFIFMDHYYSIPLDVLSVWTIDISCRIRVIRLNPIFHLTALFISLLISHSVQFFGSQLSIFSFILWYFICAYIIFRRN